jgi:hypothetical protein
VSDLQPLPSQSSAAALVRGDWTAAPTVALHIAGRGAIMGLFMAIFGERDASRLVRNSLAGSLGVELFVVAHELIRTPARPPAA